MRVEKKEQTHGACLPNGFSQNMMRCDHRLIGVLMATCCAACTTQLDAQQCEVRLETDDIQLVRDRMELGLYESGPLLLRSQQRDQVEIKWHVLTDSAGNQAIDEATLDDYLIRLSEAFAPAGIEFCANSEIDYIIDDALFADVQSTYELRVINATPNAIDIYWCPSIYEGQLCGSSSYSFGPIQGIVMQTTCLGEADVSSILIHETGHYFDLLHTHETGWGFDCPGGSACETTGDLVCDTAPSKNLQFDACVDPADCSLRLDVDACISGYPAPLCDGSPYLESEATNYMSYSPVRCLVEFTPGQHQRINATYENLRPELHSPSCSTTVPCVGDLSGDGSVRGEDLAILLSAWGMEEEASDLDGSGIVGGGDIAVLLNNWGECR